MAKRIVICADGTWNTPDQRSPTNVVKTARAISPSAPDGTAQIVFYDQGVGTSGLLDRWTGGAFGRGLEKNVEDGYRFLMHNFEEGTDVFLFGFSRGAYTVRSLAGLIRNSGLLEKVHADRFPDAYRLYRRKDAHPDSAEAREFEDAYSREIEIHFVGVWDTVGALGIPVGMLRWLTRSRHEFHDVELSRFVRNAYHALAIDEKRAPFKPSLWESEQKPGQAVEQVWFAGVHSDVGGGYRSSGLSDLAFDWMKEKAAECGLTFDEDYVSQICRPDPNGTLHNSLTWFYKLTSALRRIGGGKGGNESVHPGAITRHEGGSYSPDNLVAYLDDLERQASDAEVEE